MLDYRYARAPLSPRRRKAAIAAGAVAVLGGSMALIRHPDRSSLRYTLTGVLVGIMVGLFLMVFRKRAAR